MSALRSRFSLAVLLFVGFIEYVGVGLVFPLFPCLFFDPACVIVSSEMPFDTRGALMGYLIAINPLAIFIGAPFWGAVSDYWGRKKTLLVCLLIGVVGYLVAVYAVWTKQVGFLFLYRILSGFSAGASAVVQAAVSDVSTPENKGKNFAYFNMAWGAGFTLGPFIGGMFSQPFFVGKFGMSTPFFLAGTLMLLNWILLLKFYQNAPNTTKREEFAIKKYLNSIKRVFAFKELRVLVIAMFFFSFGWDFFAEFVSVYLIQRFAFKAAHIGMYHGLNGMVYTIGTALIAKTLINKGDPLKILTGAFLALGCYCWAFVAVNSPLAAWIFLPGLTLIVALIYPIAATRISDMAPSTAQGEVLGIYGAAQNLALMLSPILFGRYVASIPSLPLILSGMTAFVACVLVGIGLRKSKEVVVES